jgi:hypothetical protein
MTTPSPATRVWVRGVGAVDEAVNSAVIPPVSADRVPQQPGSAGAVPPPKLRFHNVSVPVRRLRSFTLPRPAPAHRCDTAGSG